MATLSKIRVKSGMWSDVSRKILIVATTVIAILAAMWPALYNGQPIFFPDTTAYLRGADAGMQKIFRVSTTWSKPISIDAKPVSPVRPSATGQDAGISAEYQAANPAREKSVLAGRSVYYGTLLYLGHLAHGLWLVVGAQSALLVATTAMVYRAFGQLAWKPFIAVFSVLVTVTPAPLFTSFLMPDLFAGIAILACAMLIVQGKALSKMERIFWAMLLLSALVFHNSHLLLALVLCFIGLLAYRLRNALHHTGLIIVGVTILAACAAGVAFNYGVAYTLGAPPISPPFLMARLIDDGPGYRYLRETCPRSGFVVCRFIGRLPLPSDEFLWAHDPDKGVFMATDAETQKALAAEQLHFAAAVLLHDPLGVATASARNAIEQTVLSGAGDFNYTAKTKADFSQKLPPEYFEAMQQTRAFAGTMPVEWFSVTGYLSSIVSIVYLVCVLGARLRGRQHHHDDSIAAFVWLSISGILVNAAICGILSGSHERYQARVIWLLPLLALLMYFSSSANAKSSPSAIVNAETTGGRIS